MSRATRLLLLTLTGTLVLTGLSRGQGREPFNLEVGDPARKTKSIALVVDQIHDTNKGVDVSPDEVAAALSDASIVLVGEAHTSIESHRVQIAVIAALQRAGRKVTIGLEMFPAEAPTAPFDRWLRGGIDEAALLRESGWYDYWGYPWGYYRDVFLIAKQYRLPIRGVNAPRAVVAMVGRRGLAGIGGMERGQIAPTIDTTNEEHKQVFLAYVGGTSDTPASATSSGAPGHGAGMPAETLQRMVDAQCTWDATMALHAAELIKDNPDPKAVVVVLVGSGHVAYGLGIARQAKAYTDKRVATVLPIASTPGKPEQIRASVADIVWGVPAETYPLFPTLGVSFRSNGDQPNTVLMVSPGSAAETMGLKPGDMLMTIDDQPIHKDVEVRALLDRKQWGDAVKATVKRGADTLTLTGRLRRR
ncbi:peptidase Do [Luteitalea pratensis]|uniref:Peptidase Do n=1 Tax=Luteitalea pratensis TaxID=1855912 RepID=A0A143PPJ5_LUTPR|nr:ChaN family lipoprotein [Luteitalea pratensis]AMY10351.1 peptidase Do [Luteitalea pratensis]